MHFYRYRSQPLGLFLNLFTSVFVYGFRILLLVALVLAFAFCASCVPTYVYLAAAPTINAVVLPLLDPDRGIRVKFFVQGKKCLRPDEFVRHGLTARQVLDRLGVAADADVELIYPAKGRKYSDDEVVAAPVVIAYMRLRLRGGAPKKKRKKATPTTRLPPPPKEKSCCCCISGKRCPNKVFCEATIKQLERMVNDRHAPTIKGRLLRPPLHLWHEKADLGLRGSHV